MPSLLPSCFSLGCLKFGSIERVSHGETFLSLCKGRVEGCIHGDTSQLRTRPKSDHIRNLEAATWS